MTEPRYQALTKENIPELTFSSGKARIIAGSLELIDETGKTYLEK